LRVRTADVNVTTTCRAEPSHGAGGGWAGGRRRSDGYRCTHRPKTQYRCTRPRKPRSRGQQPPARADESAPAKGRGMRECGRVGGEEQGGGSSGVEGRRDRGRACMCARRHACACLRHRAQLDSNRALQLGLAHTALTQPRAQLLDGRARAQATPVGHPPE
jgi:hypothetical protein